MKTYIVNYTCQGKTGKFLTRCVEELNAFLAMIKAQHGTYETC